MGKTYRFDGNVDRDIHKAKVSRNAHKVIRYSRNDRRNAKTQIEDVLNAILDDNHEFCDNSPCVDCQKEDANQIWYDDFMRQEMEAWDYAFDSSLDYDYVRDICEGCQSHKLDCICHTF